MQVADGAHGVCMDAIHRYTLLNIAIHPWFCDCLDPCRASRILYQYIILVSHVSLGLCMRVYCLSFVVGFHCGHMIRKLKEDF